jgi:hypothetical protein
MIPCYSRELLVLAMETMCYFCTAVGVVVTLLFSTRP